MISLDDPKWEDLAGGYKVPYDPRPAIRALEAGNSVDDAWDELWNELHHQGDVGEASYAAVPHLVRIQQAKSSVDWNLYALISTIEIERHRTSNPPLPDWLAAAYQQAWRQVIDLASRDLKKTDESLAVTAILGALAIAKGLLKLGAFISYSDEDEVDEYAEGHLAWSEIYSEQQRATDCLNAARFGNR